MEITMEMFIRFLKKNRAFTEYMRECRATMPDWVQKKSDKKVLEGALDKLFGDGFGLESMVEGVFYWMNARKGVDYWSDVNMKWMRLIQSNEGWRF